MATVRKGDDVYESHYEMIEAMSWHRPDTSWRFVDSSGHEHRWFVGGKPAESYSPSAKHDVPSVATIFDGWGYYEDGERYQITHLECRLCGETVKPGYTADTFMQYVPGLRYYSINDVSVSRDEFEARARQAGLL